MWEGAGDRTETAIFWPHSYGRQRCVLLVLLMLNRRPRGPLCWVMAFFTASYQQLPWTPTHQSPKAPSAWCGFPYHVSSITPSPTVTGTVWLLSWLSYIIVQRPLNRLLDLWNRMLNRRQAEIIVMQFRGHSLPVRQSMSVPWEFFTSSYFISQFPPTRFPLITAIRMCPFLPVHQSEWHFWPGRRSKYNKINLLQGITNPLQDSLLKEFWKLILQNIYFLLMNNTLKKEPKICNKNCCEYILPQQTKACIGWSSKIYSKMFVFLKAKV